MYGGILMPAVNGVAFYANFMQTRFNRSAEPTVEGDSVTDSLGDTVSAGGQVPDLTDTQRHTRITATDNGVGGTYRFDMALDQVITADFAILDNHTLRTTFNEAVGNNINIHHDSDAVFAGATQITPTQVYSGLVSKDRPYLDFDGTNDFVDMGSGIADYQQGFSFAGWVWIDAYPSSGELFVFGNTSSGGERTQITIDTDGKVRAGVYDGASWASSRKSSDSAIGTKAWVFVGYSFDGTDGTLYIGDPIDGAESGTSQPNSTSTAGFDLGRRTDAAQYCD